MLSNRFFRLITTAVLFLISLLVGALLLVPFCEDLNGIGIAVVGAFAIGLVHQVCWDFLDLGVLDNTFGKMLKRIIFLAAFLIVGFLATMLYFDQTIGEKAWGKLNFLGKAFAGSVVYVPIATAALCVLSSVLDWEHEKAPFLPLMALGGSIVVSAVVGLIGGAMLKIVPLVLLVGGIAGLVLATLNFFFMAVGTSIAADKAEAQDVKGGKAVLQLSMLVRYAALFVVLFAFGKSGLCDLIALVLPLVFVRPILTFGEFFLKKGEEKP